MQRNSTKFTYQTTVASCQSLAKDIAKGITGGEVFALIGHLGAGKTTFVSFLAKALGAKEQVSSPTFVLMQTYKGKTTSIQPLYIHHLDLYRIDSPEEVIQSGLTEHWGDVNSITLIEWADKAPSLLPKNTITINFIPL
jgi:tRNA threonylcarbamoyladenosine biosynthesis protein TsaE